MKFETKSNTMIGTKVGPAFVDGPDPKDPEKWVGGFKDMNWAVYSEEDRKLGNLFHDLRMKMNLSLGDTARIWDCKPSDVSGIELGRLSPKTPVDLATAMLLLVERKF